MYKNIILKIWPFICIVLIWFVFSYPFFLQNKIPFASTYLVNFFAPWNAYPGFSSPVKNNAMPDVISQIYPWKNFTINTYKSGQIPLWDPFSFSGSPHLANYQSAVLSPLNLIFFILPFINAWSIAVLLQPLLAGIFMLLFLRSLGIAKISSLLGAISFMFCGFITTWMGYETLGYAIVYLPLGLFAIEQFYKTAQFKYLFILLLSFPLSFFSGHFQISIYFALFIFFYSLFKLFETKDRNKFFYIFLYTLFGLLTTLPQILPSIEAYAQSLRSSIFQKVEVIPWGYFSTFIAPDFLGNPVTRNDWFGHYAEWNGFAGTITLLLSIYSLFNLKNKKILFFTLAALASILLSFAGPITDLIVLLKIPVISTSALSRIIVLFSFSISVLAAFGLDFLLADLKNFKKIFLWLVVASVIFIILWFVVMLHLFIPIDKIAIAKQNLILPSAFFGLLIFSILGLINANIRNSKRTLFLFSLLIVVLVGLDMLRFAKKWQEFDPKALAYPKIAVESELNKIKGYDRVYGNLGGEATIYYGLPSIEGYDAVYIKRYGEFITGAQDGVLSESFRSTVLFPKNGLYSQQYLNLLGVKYLIHKIADGRNVWTYPVWLYPDNYKLLYDDGAYQVFQNLKAFPRVFTANQYLVQSNPALELSTMFLNGFDLRKNVVLEKNPQVLMDSTSSDAKIISYLPDRIVIKATSNGNTMLFLSDSYYPGWSASIDGKQTQIYRADYTFRAVVLPKGSHKVVFEYLPNSFKWGAVLAIFGIFAALVIFLLRGKLILFPKT